MKIFSLLLLMSEALYLNKLARDNKLLEKGTYIIALTYLLMSFLIPYRISFYAHRECFDHHRIQRVHRYVQNQ